LLRGIRLAAPLLLLIGLALALWERAA